MKRAAIVRGPILNPRPDGTVQFLPDGVLVGDERGLIADVGNWNEVAARRHLAPEQVGRSLGWIIPPMLDAHIHIPQHPIRGRFLAGVEASAAEGPLLAGLNRNVFPAEGRCADPEVFHRVVAQFRRDTLAQGVLGGAAYMTVHAAATRHALEELGAAWHVGLVMMQQNCPEYLRTDEASFDTDVAELARDFGRRLIVTDRFAGAVGTALRKRGVALAERFNLRMQTHLNEQFAEKAWIEALYPEAKNYTDVYRRDGLLGRAPLIAHCIRMSAEEFDMLAAADGTAIVHCPVSNTLLGSGIMPLDRVVERGIPYALCTDVGASPTTSLLTEMLQFLRVHRGRSKFATPSAALWGTTLGPAKILGLDNRLGSFAPGKECSWIEVAGADVSPSVSADDAVTLGLLEARPEDLSRYDRGGSFAAEMETLQATGLEVGPQLERLTDDVEQTARRMELKVQRVTQTGIEIYRR